MFSKGAIYAAAIYMDSRRGRRVTGRGPDARLFRSPAALHGRREDGVQQLQLRISRDLPYGPRRSIGLSCAVNHAVNLESDTFYHTQIPHVGERIGPLKK